MVISYFTKKYFKWTPIFLQSWKKQHGEQEKIVFNCYDDVKNGDLKSLTSLYSNLIIKRDHFPMEHMTDKLKITKKELERHMEDLCVGKRKNDTTLVVMMYLADCVRIQKLYEVMKDYSDEKFFFHSDIDMYFRKPILNEINAFKRKYDVGIKFQLNVKRECSKTPITLLSFNNNDNVMNFMTKWLEIINSYSILEDYKKVFKDNNKTYYGQWALHRAYLEFKDKIIFYDIPDSFRDTRFDKSSEIWSGNKAITIGNRKDKYLTFDYILKTFEKEIKMNDIQKYLKLQRTKDTHKTIFDPAAHEDTQVILEMIKHIILLEEPKNILELGCGVGSTSVYFFNKLNNLKNSTFYLLDGDSGEKCICSLNYKSSKDYYNSMLATKQFCDKNEMKNYVLINYEEENIPEVKFDLVYSTFAIGFHWPISLYLDKLKSHMNKGSILLLNIRGNRSKTKRKNDFKKWNNHQIKCVKKSGDYSIQSSIIEEAWGLLVLKYGGNSE